MTLYSPIRTIGYYKLLTLLKVAKGTDLAFLTGAPKYSLGWSIITFFFSFDLVSLGISDHTQNIHCDFFWEFFETIFIAAWRHSRYWDIKGPTKFQKIRFSAYVAQIVNATPLFLCFLTREVHFWGPLGRSKYLSLVVQYFYLKIWKLA